MTKLLKGKEVAASIRQEAKANIAALKEEGVQPTLAIVRVGEDPSSVSYEKAAAASVEKTGIAVELFHYPETISEEEFLNQFKVINGDSSIHGILVMQPLPKSIAREKVAVLISPEKDIDGLSSLNLGELVQQSGEGFAPSTPTAVVALLDYYGIEIEGQDICVVGSSPVVGKPLALMLINRGATVSVCHIYTKDVKKYSQEADVIVSATGALGLITADHVKDGAAVIDVGFGYDEDGNACGDVRFEEVAEKASAITPVPGGVGAITTAILASQVTKAARLLLEKRQMDE